MRSLKMIFLFLCVSQISLANGVVVDFDGAMEKFRLDPQRDVNGKFGANGIPDSAEMALVEAVLADPSLDLSKYGGATHEEVLTVFRRVKERAELDLTLLKVELPSAVDVLVGYTLLGDLSFEAFRETLESYGVKLSGNYNHGKSMEKWFSANGDADGDGISNFQEYNANISLGREKYIEAALDPKLNAALTSDESHSVIQRSRLTVGILLYPGFEVLDVYGPLELWSYVSDFDVVLIAERKGPVISAQGTTTIASHSFDSISGLDILMVPGGNGAIRQLQNDKLMTFLQAANKQTRFTASVCTGSALLAKSGILNGHRATTNKRAFYLAEQQSNRVEWVVDARWVESGKIFTSSGVSAGMDMALGLVAKLYGEDVAKELASSIEYVWLNDASSDPFAAFVERS